MELSKLLVPGAVRVVGQFTSKKRLFQELGEIAAQAYGLSGAAAPTVCRNVSRWDRPARGTASPCPMPGWKT